MIEINSVDDGRALALAMDSLIAVAVTKERAVIGAWLRAFGRETAVPAAFAALALAVENGDYPRDLSPEETHMPHADDERCPVHALCPACARIARDALMANIGLEPLSAVNERATVVAWLQAEAQRMHKAGDRPAWFVLKNRAEAIERGEHRREEEK